MGEAFIRTCAARVVAKDVENGENIAAATEKILSEVAPLGGRGGLIAVTKAES